MFSKYESCSKSNVTHFKVSKIGNNVQSYQCEYVGEGYSSLNTKFYVISLSFASLILDLVCHKVVMEPPNVK